MYRFALIPLATLALAGPAAAAPPSLCAKGEAVAFTCSTGSRLLSVCETEGGRGLQYRYGTAAKIDLAYPPTGTTPTEAFRSGTMMYSGGGGAWLGFANGAYSYTVFTAIGRWGPNGAPRSVAGVSVTKDGADVADIACKGPDTSELGPDLFVRYGLVTDDPADSFDIPESFLPD
ncbi:MAG: hypothetical protein GC186_04145 [Rhodobacteraceae bacterium]|nr:hypothetical protein [Paracoccaceae bacterium]